jgi:hypothetical protein
MLTLGPFVQTTSKKQPLNGVDTTLVLQLWEIARKSPVVSSTLDVAATWASTSAWHIEFELRDDSQKSKSPSKRAAKSDNQLNQILTKQLDSQVDLLLKHVLIFGFAVIRYRLGKHVGREVTSADVEIEVIHPHLYTLRYTQKKNGQRKWFAFQTKGNSDSSLEEIPHSRVFIREEPEPLSGSPNSPLMRCIRTVYQYDALMANMEIVGFKKAFPPFIYRNESKAFPLPSHEKPIMGQGSLARQAAPPDGSDSTLYGFTTDEEQASYLARAQLKTNSTKAIRRIHNLAGKLDGISSQMGKISDSNKDYIDDYIESAKMHPMMPEKLLAEDIHLDTNAPKAETLSEFSELEEIFKSQIAVMLGVPLEFIFPHKGRFSSDIMLSKKIMSIRNNKLHKWLSTVIERICLDVHYDSILAIVETAAEQAIKSETGDEEKIANHHILKQKYINKLKEIILVSVHFDENTAASEQSLLLALQTSVIDHDTYSDLMLSSLGLARSLKAEMSDSSRKQLEENLRRERIVADEQPPKRQKRDLNDEEKIN